MRFLEFNLVGVSIPDTVYFFQIDFNSGWLWHICLISMNNKNIKLVKNNKYVIFYKDHKKFGKKVKKVEMDYLDYRSNFLGFYDQDKGIFLKNKNYKGSVPIYKVIGGINANLECR